MKRTLENLIAAPLFLILLVTFTGSCEPSQDPGIAATSEQKVSAAQPEIEIPPLDLDESFLGRLKTEKWSGDIDGMVERRFIRALVFYNKTNFFYDGPQPRGITYEALKEFEKFLNGKLKTGDKPVHIVFIPVSRSEALKRMSDRRADIAASNLPITPELQKIG